MSRDSERAPRLDLPWQAQVVKVADERPRIRVPKQLAAAVSWLGSSQTDLQCVAMVGVRGGLAIYPTALFEIRSELATALSKKRLRRSAAGSEALDIVRYAAATWELTISVEANRYTLYLPEESRKLGLVPDMGELGVVFCSGEILEIWKVPDWIQYLRDVGRDISRLERTVLMGLRSDESEE